MTAANELAPCKHCGSPVELHVGHQELMFFYCTNDDCYAITSFRATPELGKRKAIERWNRRAQPAETVDEAAEREVFEKFYTGAKRYRSMLGYHSPYAERWDGWMAAVEARARAERPLESLLGEDMQDAKD